MIEIIIQFLSWCFKIRQGFEVKNNVGQKYSGIGVKMCYRGVVENPENNDSNLK